MNDLTPKSIGDMLHNLTCRAAAQGHEDLSFEMAELVQLLWNFKPNTPFQLTPGSYPLVNDLAPTPLSVGIRRILESAVNIADGREGDVTIDDKSYATTDLTDMIELEQNLCSGLGASSDDVSRTELMAAINTLFGKPAAPIGWLLLTQGRRAPDDCEEYEVFVAAGESSTKELASYFREGRAKRVFTDEI